MITKKFFPVVFALAIPFAAMPVVHATEIAEEQGQVSYDALREQGVDPKDLQEAADLLEQMFDTPKRPEDLKEIFVDYLGEDKAAEVTAEVGLTVDELFSEERVDDGTGFRDAGTFLTCMKNEAGDDLKSAFDINAVAAFLGQKQYAKAAAAIIEHLAKQGIKRNAAGLAATLAWYGFKCKSSW